MVRNNSVISRKLIIKMSYIAGTYTGWLLSLKTPLFWEGLSGDLIGSDLSFKLSYIPILETDFFYWYQSQSSCGGPNLAFYYV